jgi:hypothetical protein
MINMTWYIDVAIQMGAYITVIVLAFLFMNWISNGFIFPSMLVKLSRGRKTLVFVSSMNGGYYRAGKLVGGFLLYKDSEKEEHRVPVSGAECVGHIGNTKAIIVDEDTDTIIKPDYKADKGFDGVKFQNLYIRALMSPTLQDKTIKLIATAVVVAAIASVVSLYLIYRQGIKLSEIEITINAIECAANVI